MKFYEIMAQSFIKKANLIERNLDILKNENLPERLVYDINSIYAKYDQVKNVSKQRIEQCTQYDFKNPNLFLILFLYREISTFFNEVKNLVVSGKIKTKVPPTFFLEMKDIKETMMTLAFIGDSAIELGVVQSIWHPENPNTIPTKGTLDSTKKFITQGAHQAVLWDFLDLYDSEILIQSPNKSMRLKSSQFETIFGIIYLEAGLEAVESAIGNLKKNHEKGSVETPI
ncbi:MAG: hypothetical protein A4E35_01942 [Methanoregula sp. PtaU1.Bin051]|nr:MAG: hypothetical protein A4E35_01942 [Methanoregula sp. PtaU1.Bin051]